MVICYYSLKFVWRTKSIPHREIICYSKALLWFWFFLNQQFQWIRTRKCSFERDWKLVHQSIFHFPSSRSDSNQIRPSVIKINLYSQRNLEQSTQIAGRIQNYYANNRQDTQALLWAGDIQRWRFDRIISSIPSPWRNDRIDNIKWYFLTFLL